jgi:hypothetical protein
VWLLQGFCFFSPPLGVNNIYRGILWVTGGITELIIIWRFIALGVLAVGRLLLPLTDIIGICYAWLGTQLIPTIYVLAGTELIPPLART